MKKTNEFISIQGRNLRTPQNLRKRFSSTIQNAANVSTTKIQRSDSIFFPPKRLKLGRNNSLNPASLSMKPVKKKSPEIKIEYEDPPSTPAKGVNNERIFWKKRKLGNLPLLVLIYEGVIGTHSKSCLWSDERPSFNVRDHLRAGLDKLKSQFYCVLISTYSRCVSSDLVNFMSSHSSQFDAIYMQRNRIIRPRHIHDISFILEEFNISDSSFVMAISALGIERNEVLDRKDQEMILESTTSSHKKYLTYYAPTFEKESPVTILIPHFSFQNNYQTFYDLAEFVLKIKSFDSNFFRVFEKIIGFIKLKTTFLTSETKYTDTFLSLHRFIFFTKENTRIMKPLKVEMSKRRPKRIVL